MTTENPVHFVTSISGRWVRLRPVSRADYPTLFQWRADVDMVHLWNLSRRTVGYEEFIAEFEQSLRNSLFMAIIDRETDRLIGYSQTYNASPWDRWVFAAVYVTEAYRGKAHFPETAMLAMDVFFKWFPLEKVYVEVYEFAHWAHILPPLGFVEEGFTPNHFWHDGRYWGLTKYALYRERWPEARERMQDILNVRQRLEEPVAVKPES
jgi:RimJ/RimL family protein N-acetyltransferase